MTDGRRDDGFSLVELLTVIVILGVLAGLAVPTYLNQRAKAFRAAMVSDLRSLVTAQEGRGTNGATMYTDDLALLRTEGFDSSGTVSAPTIVLFNNGTDQFVACVTHTAVDEWLVYNSVTGGTTYSPVECTAPPG